MSESSRPEGPRPANPRELQAMVRAEREGVPFLVCRDANGAQRFLRLPGDRAEVWIGRSPEADLCLEWDAEVSAVHAQVEQAAGDHALVDDGLSRNGSYVNGERVGGRRRLQDGDVLRFGRTSVLYRAPSGPATEPTVTAQQPFTADSLTEQQRKVLIALCRPFKGGDPFATPPTNQQIADELFLTVDAVKVHLRALFEKLDVAELPQNKKRLALVGRALQSGVVTDREL